MFPLALSIGGLGGVATWLAFGPLSGLVVIWGIFVAWGAFFHSGGDSAALRSTIICGILGAVLAGVALFLAGILPLGGLAAPVAVGLMVFVLVMLASIPAFSTIPAAVYGFALTAALALTGGGSVTALSTANPVVVMSISIIVGAVFGLVSGKLSAMISGS
ncbi:MAG: DUF1097 domain-containing protein [Methylophagaceae bacterium]